jgi:hypothetical protein
MTVVSNSTFLDAFGDKEATSQQFAALTASNSLATAQAVLGQLYANNGVPASVSVAPGGDLITVGLVLNRANDPTALLESSWAVREAALANQTAVFATYGANPATYGATLGVVNTTVGSTAPFTMASDAGYISSPADRTIWLTLNPTQFIKSAGAILVDVVLPEFDEATMKWVALCGLEAALAHEATFPSRRAEYGPDLAALIDLGRGLSALELGKLQLVRSRLKGEIEGLLASVDLLLMPVMGVAAPSLAALKAAGRTPQTTAARLRYTAPFDMSGHPTLTLPGGVTSDGVPVGFQIVGHAFDEAGILAAGHAYQEATDWHLKRPPL